MSATPPERPPLTCPYCGAAINNRHPENLRRHVATAHSIVVPPRRLQ